MQKIVIYHANCPDGFTAAWVFHQKHGDAETQYVAIGHNNQDDLYKLDIEDKDVFFVDFCPNLEAAHHFISKSQSVMILDHHKSAVAVVEQLDDSMYIMDMERSGAGIAWDYCFPDKPRAPIVDYVQDRDLWKWEIGS